MKTIEKVRAEFRTLLPDELNTELGKSQLFEIEAALQFCNEFLSHEGNSTDLVLLLGENYPNIINWQDKKGLEKYRSLLRILPRMSRQVWQNNLISYQKLSPEHRCFEITDDGSKFIPLDIGDFARKEFLQRLFETSLIHEPVKVEYFKTDEADNYVKTKYYRAGQQYEKQYCIPKMLSNSVKAIDIPKPRSRKMTSSHREEIVVTKEQLISRGKKLDLLDKEQNRHAMSLATRCENLELNSAIDSGGGSDGQIIFNQKPIHIVGKPSSGKSTLVRSIVPELAARGYRILILVNTTAQAHIQSEQFRRHGVNSTVWCSWKNRDKYANNIYLSNEQIIPLKDGFPHVGNIAGGCLLRAFQSNSEEELSRLSSPDESYPPPYAGDGICLSLFDPRKPNDKPRACPFHLRCPSFAQERATLGADVIVMTAQALTNMRPSPFYYPQHLTMIEWVNEFIDLVVADEVDEIQMLLDDAQSIEQQMYSGEAYGNILSEMTSRHMRIRADGGKHHQLEACLNMSPKLESYIRWATNLISDVTNRKLGRAIFCNNGYNEHTILKKALYFLSRKTSLIPNNFLQQNISSINKILELITLIEKQYIKCAKENIEYSFYQQIPIWLAAEHKRFSIEELSVGWALARLTYYIQHQLPNVDRPESHMVTRCSELWNEPCDSTQLKGGLILFKTWVEKGLTEKAAIARNKQRELYQKDLQTILVIAVMTRLARRTYEKLSYPAQQLTDEELAVPAAISQAARLERIYRSILPSTLIQGSSQFDYKREDNNKHSVIFRKQLAPGRSLLYHLPSFRESEGIAGPHLLLLSGTSYAGRNMRFPSNYTELNRVNETSLASPDYDVDFAVTHILEQPKSERDAITQQSIFAPLVIENDKGKPLRVSGSGKLREKNVIDLASGLLNSKFNCGKSMLESHFEDAQARWGDDFSGRKRALLVASSFDMVDVLMEELTVKLALTHWKFVGIRKDDMRIKDRSPLPKNGQWLNAAEVESFGDFPENSILIAPISMISRGHNILCQSPTLNRKVAAISHIYFLNRPHPHPTDQTALRGFHNRFINALSLSSFEKEANEYDNSLSLLNKKKEEATRRYNKALQQQLPIAQMNEESRIRILYRALIQIWQTVCRGVRGGVPVYAGFLDSAFHPQSSIGEEDNSSSSLLVGINELLEHLLDPKWNPDAALAQRLFDTPRVAFSRLTNELKNVLHEINTNNFEDDEIDELYDEEDEYEF